MTATCAHAPVTATRIPDEEVHQGAVYQGEREHRQEPRHPFIRVWHLLEVQSTCQLGPMDKLTSRQRAHLRKLAHHLKPIVLVGGEGVTPAVLSSVEEAFNTRELIKVKLQESAPLHVKDAAGELSSGVADTQSVQTIGRTVVLYRPHPENPEIRLPKAGG